MIELIVKFNDGGYPIESEVVRMNVLPKSIERRSLLSVSESLQLMLAFGGFTLTLITTIVAILNYKDKKK
ncbi:TPA: putative holin-like toxin [Enterococcus faecalis]|nr:putative holin-like toxin [Enterococcus faecalis]HAP4453032.1 putative holin-like toxin [Enterococcus faecalis]HAP4458935.1 putative holin-like toxin [Enterococcus faecalis]HAP4462321.1 putative holin-like toxin [Enterococcus faecalis]HAP4471464.1 putative holin-like toxin [Enterococcus faecalis]